MSARDIEVRGIPRSAAVDFVRRHHYSGKVDPRSQVHLGVFYNDRLEGVMQLGPSIDKAKSVGLVRDTSWNGFIELHRMAFSDVLPKNSESRAIGVAMGCSGRRPHTLSGFCHMPTALSVVTAPSTGPAVLTC